MPNPIKAIKGGIQGVKNASNTIKANNNMVKSGTGVRPMGAAPLKKVSMTPKVIAKSFVNGAKNPSAAKSAGPLLKTMAKDKG